MSLAAITFSKKMPISPNAERINISQRINKVIKYDDVKKSARSIVIDRYQFYIHGEQERQFDNGQGRIQERLIRLEFCDGHPKTDQAMIIADKLGAQFLQELAGVATNIDISIALLPCEFGFNTNPRINGLLISIILSDLRVEA